MSKVIFLEERPWLSQVSFLEAGILGLCSPRKTCRLPGLMSWGHPVLKHRILEPLSFHHLLAVVQQFGQLDLILCFLCIFLLKIDFHVIFKCPFELFLKQLW